MNKNKVSAVFCFFILAITVSSCGRFDEIEIGEPQEIQVRGFEENSLVVFAAIPVDNPTIHRIFLKEIDLRVSMNNRYIGKLLVDEKILIKPMHKEVYRLPVKIRLANILNMAFVMMNMKKGQEVNFKFEGTVKVKTMLITKTIPIDETRNIKM